LRFGAARVSATMAELGRAAAASQASFGHGAATLCPCCQRRGADPAAYDAFLTAVESWQTWHKTQMDSQCPGGSKRRRKSDDRGPAASASPTQPCTAAAAARGACSYAHDDSAEQPSIMPRAAGTFTSHETVTDSRKQLRMACPGLSEWLSRQEPS
jgi:hypothetical protein